MGIEVERKFLVLSDAWRGQAESCVPVLQGYLAETAVCSIRVRVAGDRAWLNFKGLTIGARRTEFEYPIPVEEALQMLDLYCEGRLIEKTRHLVPYAGHVWEIDEFHGANAGLVVAEIELANEDEAYARPEWMGREVTDDPSYYNIRLVEHPWEEWDHD